MTTRRHLIVEGMDGSGKDTLVDQLLKIRPWPQLHDRASTSLGGPVDDLDTWVLRSITKMAYAGSPRYIFNRHPLVSESIYAPFRKSNPGFRGKFLDPQWIVNQRVQAAKYAILVICDPGWQAVRNNLLKSPRNHMPGVMDNADILHHAYKEFMWPGPTLRFCYSRDTPESLMRTISIMEQNGEV
jgi:hypothetical protein